MKITINNFLTEYPMISAEVSNATVVDACVNFRDATIEDDFDVVRMYQLRFMRELFTIKPESTGAVWTIWIKDDEGIHRMFVCAYGSNKGAIWYKNKLYIEDMLFAPYQVTLTEPVAEFKYTKPTIQEPL